MSTLPFLARSLLASALFVLSVLLVRRVAVAKYGVLPPPTTVQLGFMVVMSLLLGAQVTAWSGGIAGDAALSRWAGLLSGATLTTLSVYNLHRIRKPDTGMPLEPLLSKICLGIGTLMMLIGIVSLWKGRP
jgi:hypothetical protein